MYLQNLKRPTIWDREWYKETIYIGLEQLANYFHCENKNKKNQLGHATAINKIIKIQQNYYNLCEICKTFLQISNQDMKITIIASFVYDT